jgi:hypothetical protein
MLATIECWLGVAWPAGSCSESGSPLSRDIRGSYVCLFLRTLTRSLILPLDIRGRRDGTAAVAIESVEASIARWRGTASVISNAAARTVGRGLSGWAVNLLCERGIDTQL